MIVLSSLISLCHGYGVLLAEEGQPHDEEMPRNDLVSIVYCSEYQFLSSRSERSDSLNFNKNERIYHALIEEHILNPNACHVPRPIYKKDILRVHTPQFLDNLQRPLAVAACFENPRLANFPSDFLDRELLLPFRYNTGGTLLASRLALRHGIGINLGGGYNHSTPDSCGGLCVYADMQISIRVLQAENKIRRALIIDLDVHQGNGTAVCLADNDETFTFSMHQRDIYPIPKEKSDLDVELSMGVEDKEYLDILGRHLNSLFENAKPEIVFYQAGSDTLYGDPLATLMMTERGIVIRDGMVIDACVKRNIPVVMTLGGGYSAAAWRAQFYSIRQIVQKYGLNGYGMDSDFPLAQ